MSIKVMLIDDHPIVLQGIKSILALDNDMEIVAEASNGREAVELAQEKNPDVVVMDISLPELNGLEAGRKIMKQNRNIKVLFLSMHENRVFIEKTLSFGAMGYLLKDSAPEEITRAVREVYSGRYFLSAKISNFVIHDFVFRKNKSLRLKSVSILTGREREILQLIAEGFSSKAIAQKLKLSTKTVLAHRNNIMKKLDLHNEAQIVRFALKESVPTL